MDVKIKGIDVSGWQGDINFKKVAQDNVDFVIVKAGYTTSTVETWEKNYTNAKHNGLKVGAYWYSTATTIDEVMAEIKAFKKALKGKELDYPVYYDIEEQATFAEGKAFVTKMVETFCEEMKKDKFYPGIYCSTYWYENYVEESTRKKYPAWIADYRGKCYYTGDIGIWQWGVGNVSGISGDVDMDISYVDYSVEIKVNGYNGFDKPIISEVKKTVKELAQEYKDKQNGEIVIADDKKGLYIKLKDGLLSVLEIQGENAKRMNTLDYLRGNKIDVGNKFE